jgi:branched-chain amino acid transport system substrate-binding protein
MSTRGLHLRLAAVLAGASLAVAACGGGSATSSGQSDDKPGSKAPQGVTDTAIKIGATMPITGPIAGAGGALSNGLKIAVASVNAAGGINGRKVEVTILDDQYQTPKSVANIRKLASDHYALVNPIGTQLIPASWDFIKESGIPTFGPVSPPDPKLKNVFGLGASIQDQSAVMADHLISKGFKKIGVIYLQGEFGDAEKKGIEAVLAKHPDVKIVTEQSLPVTELNVSSYVLNAQKAKPEAFILGSQNTTSYLILKEAERIGWKPFFIGNGNTVTTPEISKLDFAEGLVSTAITQSLDADTEGIKRFKADAEKYTPGTAPTLQTLQTYANAMVFFEAVKRAGDDLSWDNLMKTIEGIKDYDTGIYPSITFGPLPDGHFAASGSLITQLKNHTFVPVSSEFVEPSVG